MAKVTIYCLVRKKEITLDEKLAHALIKMNRGRLVYKELAKGNAYQTRMMVAEPSIVEVKIIEVEPEIKVTTPKKPAEKKTKPVVKDS